MKIFGTCVFLLSVLTVTRVSAAPCTNFDPSILVGTFTVMHSASCTKKALQSVTFQQVLPSQKRTKATRNGEGMSVQSVYAVSNFQFAADADPIQVRTMQLFDQVAMVSFAQTPDLCFLMWYSSTNPQPMDMNTIMGKDASGNLQLGSNNKLDGNLYMTLNR